jgi:hypothetical protein
LWIFLDILVRLKLAFSMHHINSREVCLLHFSSYVSQEVTMRLRTFFAAAALTALFAAAPVVAHAEHDGDWDDHHSWHDSGWWHEHHPGWVYRHHPEWAERHEDWRRNDGDWDDHHAWHSRTWWYDHHPNWVRAHHPNWVRWHEDD